MSLLDQTTYRRLTGDTTSYSGTSLQDAMTDAQSAVEAKLRRPIQSASRSEYLISFIDQQPRSSTPFTGLSTSGLVVYPNVTPVVSVPAGYVILSSAKVQVGSDFNGLLVYTGGWTLLTIPFPILNALACKTKQLLIERTAGGPGELVDPEGNVIPVVPPFDEVELEREWSGLNSYVKPSPTGLA